MVSWLLFYKKKDPERSWLGNPALGSRTWTFLFFRWWRSPGARMQRSQMWGGKFRWREEGCWWKQLDHRLLGDRYKNHRGQNGALWSRCENQNNLKGAKQYNGKHTCPSRRWKSAFFQSDTFSFNFSITGNDLESEGNDRSDIKLPGKQLEVLQAATEGGNHSVSVSSVSKRPPMDLTFFPSKG